MRHLLKIFIFASHCKSLLTLRIALALNFLNQCGNYESTNRSFKPLSLIGLAACLTWATMHLTPLAMGAYEQSLHVKQKAKQSLCKVYRETRSLIWVMGYSVCRCGSVYQNWSKLGGPHVSHVLQSIWHLLHQSRPAVNACEAKAWAVSLKSLQRD